MKTPSVSLSITITDSILLEAFVELYAHYRMWSFLYIYTYN